MNKQRESHALKLDDVTFTYDEDTLEPIIEKLSLSINHGEFVSIIGASGSGKSTIFRLIAGLEQQISGTIAINGQQTEKRLGQVGYMPQQDLLMPWRTIIQNARLPLELAHKNFENSDIKKYMTRFGLAGYENKYPHELSGGMRQRVSFLRATLSGSDILLLDEPFSALDAMTKLFMQEWLLEQWEETKQTILFITHDISEALFLSDRIFILTEQPIRQLEELVVPIQRPRKQADLNKPEVIALRESLIEQFRSQVSYD